MTIWLAIFGLGLLLSLFFGRGYCGYVCPMNTVMRPAEWLSKKMNLQRTTSPKWLQSYQWPRIFLALSVVLMLSSKRMLQVNFPVLLLFLAVSFLVTLFYKPEIFHNQICPFGALLRLSGKISLRSENVKANKCNGCRLCEKICPAGAVQVLKTNGKALIDPAFCHQCQDCETVCPKDAIHYTRIV